MRRILAVLLMIGFWSYGMIDTPAETMRAKNHHAAIAAGYEKDAKDLRLKAKEMEMMVQEYEKDPEGAQQQMVHTKKVDFAEQCKTLARIYTEAAD
ncbi:MAG: hypothetical protein ABI980_15285 [Nitrospirota bacterium]